jgi:ketosteroid isomerase-like protein
VLDFIGRALGTEDGRTGRSDRLLKNPHVGRVLFCRPGKNGGSRDQDWPYRGSFNSMLETPKQPNTSKLRIRRRLVGVLRSCALVCVFLASVCAATAAWSQERRALSDQEALIALEQRWNDAFYRRDMAFIESVLAEEFVATYEDGTRGDKAKELALAAAFNQQVESAIQDDFSVRVYRDTAVVWFTLQVVGIKQGKRAELTLRYTDVWVMRDGRWQCVSSQSTRVP